MFARGAIRHAALAVLVPLLLLNAGSARALYRCIYDNVARTRCCCPPSAKPVQPAEPAASRASCCDIEQPKADAKVQLRVERTDTPQLRMATQAPSPLPHFAMLAAATALPPAKVGLDPPPGPSLLLVKRSFLI